MKKKEFIIISILLIMIIVTIILSKFIKQPLKGNNYTITFDTNGGNGVILEKIYSEKEGYNFDKWYLDKTLNHPYYNYDKITEDTTLYAKWIKDSKTKSNIEISNFKVNNEDILVGKTETVIFTAEIFSKIDLSNIKIAVIDSDGNIIGYMYDNGLNEDLKANDGVYTLKANLSSTTSRGIDYQVMIKDIESKKVYIYFYKPFEEDYYGESERVFDIIHNAMDKYLDKNGDLLPGKYDEAVIALKKCLDEIPEVIWYNLGEDMDLTGIHLDSGMIIYYGFHLKGYD